MRVLFTILAGLLLFPFNGQAEDTTWVQVHNQVDMTWYGHYRQWGEFPAEGNSYRKVLLHYTMGCASTGCSGWDYDTHVLLRHRTTDSTNIAPNFIFNQDGVWAGDIPESITYTEFPSYSIVTDTLNLTYDTTWNTANEIVFLGDETSLFSHTDTILAYPTDPTQYISLDQIPYHFIVNQSYAENLSFSFDTVFSYQFIDSLNTTSIEPIDAVELIIFDNNCDASDTLSVWPVSNEEFVITDNFDSLLVENLFYEFEYEYDSLGNITDTLSATLFANEQYNYDNNGNISDTIVFYADTIIHNFLNPCGWITQIDSFTIDSILFSTTSTSNEYYSWNKIEEYEVARNITPYGTYMNPANGSYGTNGYTEDWEHTFVYDVTDYQHLLTDSVEISAFYSGWSSGFSVTLDFEFIEGDKSREVIDLSNIYFNKSSSGYFASQDYVALEHGLTSKSYSNSADFESNQMPPVEKTLLETTEEAMIRFVPTGHGQSGEFTPGIYYTLNVNNNEAGSNQMWKDDCGFNAIWPQGGTWIFDRANWCPGEAVPIFDHEITEYVNAGENTFDIDFTSFNPSDGASYSCAVQLFEYKANAYQVDAEIIDIIAPSTHDLHSRVNPICGKPSIQIKNGGSNTLTSLDIQYGVQGGVVHNYEWTGSLAYRETAIIELPHMSSWEGSAQIFEVLLENPNGETDEEPNNNQMQSAFETPPVYDNEFRVYLKTNNMGNETAWSISNANELFYSRSNCASNTFYLDTISLDNGCYTFTINDSGNDGLDFWWSNAQTGTGQIKFQNLSIPSFFKTFHPDFGSKIVHHFIVGEFVGTEELTSNEFIVYPNPSQGRFHIDGLNSESELFVTNILGKTVLKKQTQDSNTVIDLSQQPKGIYLLNIRSGNHISSQKLILN